MILSFRRNRIRNIYIVGELKIEGKENEIKTNGLVWTSEKNGSE
jgi:hypothetical protein